MTVLALALAIAFAVILFGVIRLRSALRNFDSATRDYYERMRND